MRRQALVRVADRRGSTTRTGRERRRERRSLLQERLQSLRPFDVASSALLDFGTSFERFALSEVEEESSAVVVLANGSRVLSALVVADRALPRSGEFTGRDAPR